MAQEALILYYSQFGNTARLASKIRQLTGADILRIQPTTDFPADMKETDRVYRQQRRQGQWPKLANQWPDFNYYDVILVGGPVWDGQLSSPVLAALEQLQGFAGKVAPFSTGWSELGNYEQDWQAHAGKLRLCPGYHVLTHGRPHYDQANLMSWLRKL
ncbi:flavodoxin family protein [Limosilactobacillus antri]|nr:flavodoxin [Limosilactobacillus antri]EEW52988.1 hypothetical protein HMPREF0494_1711 [Limosilactobacillus antri DSM 16041]